MSRYNIFHTPHKPWRAAVNDLVTMVKGLDSTDKQQVRELAKFARCVFAAHNAHTQSENNILAPALKRPELVPHWIEAHGVHLQGVHQVEEDISLLGNASSPSKMSQLGSKLQRDLAHFVQFDTLHTKLEEQSINMYNDIYNDQELFDLDVKATSYWANLGDDIKLVILPYFIKAHSGDDLIRILKIFKQIFVSKPDYWKTFTDMAKKELKATQVSKFENMNLFE